MTALRYNKTEAEFKSHYIHKRFFMQSVYQWQWCSSWEKKTESAILFIYVAIVFVLELRL